MSSLHWPSTVEDLDVGDISHVELIILYGRWAGERLVLEKAVLRFQRADRPISVSAVPSGPSIDIWRSRRFLGALLSSLEGLPGGLGRFLPCRIGAHHCRLRSIGLEQCGPGLTSRPLEASHASFLDHLLVLFGYSEGYGESLVAGTHRMRHCSFNFSGRKPTWGLPDCGQASALVTTGGPDVGLTQSDFWSGVRKRIRLTKNTNPGLVSRLHPRWQPNPKRWRSFSVQSPVDQEWGGEGKRRRVVLSHIDEREEIG